MSREEYEHLKKQWDERHSEDLARRIVVALYCGELDPFRGVIEEAVHRRDAVLSGVISDKGPVTFTTRVLYVNGKQVIKVCE